MSRKAGCDEAWTTWSVGENFLRLRESIGAVAALTGECVGLKIGLTAARVAGQ